MVLRRHRIQTTTGSAFAKINVDLMSMLVSPKTFTQSVLRSARRFQLDVQAEGDFNDTIETRSFVKLKNDEQLYSVSTKLRHLNTAQCERHEISRRTLYTQGTARTNGTFVIFEASTFNTQACVKFR